MAAEQAQKEQGTSHEPVGADVRGLKLAERTAVRGYGAPGTARPTDRSPLDAAAFGVARTRLWSALARQGAVARCVEAADGRMAGVGMSRAGSRARYLGPVVAASPVAGLALIEALLADHPGEPVYWDIPDPNTAAVVWAETHGFQLQRVLTRMFLGDNRTPGDPRLQFALAGPEVG